MCCNLIPLVFSNNRIGGNGATKLAPALAGHPALRTFKVNATSFLDRFVFEGLCDLKTDILTGTLSCEINIKVKDSVSKFSKFESSKKERLV